MTMQTVESRIRNNNLILRQERAQSRVMRWLALSVFSLVLFIIGMGVWGESAFVLLGAISITGGFVGAFGFVVDGMIALQPIEPDETMHRTYTDAAPRQIKIIQHDGQTLRLTDLGLDAHEVAIIAARLKRGEWYWSRRVLEGRRNDTTITNLNARYPDMLAEMQRVGALYQDGGRWRVEKWAREQISPTLRADD